MRGKVGTNGDASATTAILSFSALLRMLQAFSRIELPNASNMVESEASFASLVAHESE